MGKQKHLVGIWLDEAAMKVYEELPNRQKSEFISNAIKNYSNTKEILNKLDKLDQLCEKIDSLEQEIESIKKSGITVQTENQEEQSYSKKSEEHDITKLDEEKDEAIFGALDNFGKKFKKAQKEKQNEA
ncbi:hypothetical protein [Natranaerobius trueperi]|uniref:Uncharacterized protein n=1 Tax=Natranaerobius trueperi TaxID=759412 RepID=A0A226BUR2_9FIRM|nr:hypothetical protein [Natranaerobius trueperi]OWZ82736.1 hypothetical protein CDO51_12465 [Natranaerobius trueperi]